MVDFTGWGLRDGDDLDFIGKASLAAGPNRGSSDTATLSLVVKDPGECLRRSTDQADPLPEGGQRRYAIREEIA